VTRIWLARSVVLSAKVNVNASAGTGSEVRFSTSLNRAGRKEPPVVTQVAAIASLPRVTSSAKAVRPNPAWSAPNPTASSRLRSRKSRRFTPD